MLAWTIGWQEVLLILLFLLGIIVIPLPGRWMRRRARRPVRWSDEVLAPPIDRIHDVVEAFFCSYPGGEYSLVGKERFRLILHRGGQAQEEDDGRIVLSLRREMENPEDMPVTLRVLFQPSAEALRVTLKHEVLPRRPLGRRARRKLARHIAREIGAFREYLYQSFGQPAAMAEGRRPVKRIEARHGADV